jgi:hypothetical protein
MKHMSRPEPRLLEHSNSFCFPYGIRDSEQLDSNTKDKLLAT